MTHKTSEVSASQLPSHHKTGSSTTLSFGKVMNLFSIVQAQEAHFYGIIRRVKSIIFPEILVKLNTEQI